MKSIKSIHLFLCVAACCLLASCSGGGSGSAGSSGGGSGSTVTYKLGGTVTGLSSGTSLVLQLVVSNSGNTADSTNTLTVTGVANSANVTFVSPAYVSSGGNYIVLVASQPAGGQICTVSNSSGTNVLADVTSISVVCSTTSYTVSVTTLGLLAGQGLTLLNNNADPLSITADGTYTFATPVASGGGYSVSIKSAPLASSCSVINGSGSNVSTNVTNIGVQCGAAAGDQVLYSFVASPTGTPQPDAAQPKAALLWDPATSLFYGVTSFGGTTGAGTAFTVSPSGTETVIHNFGPFSNGTDGWCAQAPLIMGNDGNLYGVTCDGGQLIGQELGTIYQLTPSGKETIIHAFTGPDGSHPFAALMQASDGNLYGTTSQGGVYNNGTVFKINASGTSFAVLHSFGAPGDGAIPHSSVVQGTDTNLYGTTLAGGTYNAGTAYQISINGGSDVILHQFGSWPTDGKMTAPGTAPYDQAAALVQYSDGYFYGTTPSGGQNGFGTVFKVNASGNSSYSIVYSFAGGTADAQDSQSSLLLASDGYFYGTSILGGLNGKGTVFRISANGVENLMYSFGGPGDGATPIGELIQAPAPDGHLYGTTYAGGKNGQGTVFKL